MKFKLLSLLLATILLTGCAQDAADDNLTNTNPYI